MPFLLFSGALCAWCCHAPWRRGFAALLLLVVWEGALRKWVMPGASNYLLFLKDVLLVLIAIKAWREMHAVARYLPPPLIALLVVFFGYGCLEIFNPLLPSPLVGIYGVKAFLLYTVLLFLVPAAFRTPDEFRQFMRFFLLLAIPSLAIAFVQFNAAADSQLNIAVRDRGYVDTFGAGENARAAGTFGYITGLAHFICFVFTWVAVHLLQDESRKWRRVYLAVSGLALGAAFTNGGRFSVMFIVVMAAGMLLLSFVKRDRSARVKKVWRVAAAGTFTCFVGFFVFRGAALAFQDRVETTSDPWLTRLWLNVAEPFELLTITGRGIGATHSGAIAFAETILRADFQHILAFSAEWAWSRVMIELGLPGFLLWLGIIATIFVAAVQLTLRLRDLRLATIAAACAIYCFLNLLSNMSFDHVLAVFYWFVAGMVFAVERWSRQAPFSSAHPWPARRAGNSSSPLSRLRNLRTR